MLHLLNWMPLEPAANTGLECRFVTPGAASSIRRLPEGERRFAFFVSAFNL